MASKPLVFINLPVTDVKRSMDFFKALGFTFNPQFTDDKGACLVINDGASYAMLVTKEFFKTFISTKDIADATRQTETLIALSAENREEVDEMIKKAVEAGGVEFREPQVHGDWMYGRSFEDLDGHIWEIIFMDMSKVPANPGAQS